MSSLSGDSFLDIRNGHQVTLATLLQDMAAQLFAPQGERPQVSHASDMLERAQRELLRVQAWTADPLQCDTSAAHEHARQLDAFNKDRERNNKALAQITQHQRAITALPSDQGIPLDIRIQVARELEQLRSTMSAAALTEPIRLTGREYAQACLNKASQHVLAMQEALNETLARAAQWDQDQTHYQTILAAIDALE